MQNYTHRQFQNWNALEVLKNVVRDIWNEIIAVHHLTKLTMVSSIIMDSLHKGCLHRRVDLLTDPNGAAQTHSRRSNAKVQHLQNHPCHICNHVVSFGQTVNGSSKNAIITGAEILALKAPKGGQSQEIGHKGPPCNKERKQKCFRSWLRYGEIQGAINRQG